MNPLKHALLALALTLSVILGVSPPGLAWAEDEASAAKSGEPQASPHTRDIGYVMPQQPRTKELALLDEACGGLWEDPAELLALSKAAWEDSNPERGYRYAALIRQLHPESDEARTAFALAAPALPHLYYRTRHNPRSKWVHAEPVFLMEWLADIWLASGDAFPSDATNQLLVPAPKSLRLLFEAYAADHPVLSRHALRFKMENGMVEYVAEKKN